MPTLKAGDRVRVVSRDQTLSDLKENAYFPHMAGLQGTVAKVYSPEEVVVNIDRDSLPEQNAARHTEIETRLHERWLDSLSQDARSNLSEPEQQFHLHYSVLLPASDLEVIKGARKAAKPAQDEDVRVHTGDLDRTEEEYLRSRKA